MTDLEMMKLCADAMGLNVSPWGENNLEYRTWHGPDGNHPTLHIYNPLHDDAQAMALVKKIGLDIVRIDTFWTVGQGYTLDVGVDNADLNRAICECVAKMEESKSK